MTFFELEQRRKILQRGCDDARTQLERNRLGQFATPFELAAEIVKESVGYTEPDTPIRFLDPAFGTGPFYSALLQQHGERIESALGLEIDAHYGGPSKNLWQQTRLDLKIGDFLHIDRSSIAANLLICNPPYVRHHHLKATDKAHLNRVMNQLGFQVSGLAGLYCYFMLLAHQCLAPGAVSAWLVPSEFMDVNYGKALRQYLLERVQLLRLHRFDPTDVQFADALVSSVVVWFRNATPNPETEVDFTFGGTIDRPLRRATQRIATLAAEPKWTRIADAGALLNTGKVVVALGDLFVIKRGIATGDNGFFIVSEEKVRELGFSREFLRPILPSPRYLTGDEIDADAAGIPLLERRLYLIDCRLGEVELSLRDRALFDYLKSGESSVAKGYLCRSRSPWYAQESRPASPFVCTYMGRAGAGDRPAFRFIHNRSQATAANVYLLLYPRPVLRGALEVPGVADRVFDLLRGIPAKKMTGEGRVYGGGLHKLEPRELANVPLEGVEEILAGKLFNPTQMSFAYPTSIQSSTTFAA